MTPVETTLRTRAGVVGEFDVERGLGTVRDTEGANHPFHCTEIVDGTRSMAPGTAVRYRLVPGHLGRFEAAAIEPIEAVAATATVKGATR